MIRPLLALLLIAGAVGADQPRYLAADIQPMQTSPPLKQSVPVRKVPRRDAIQVDETAQLNKRIASLERQVEQLREQTRRMGSQLEAFRREFSAHYHGVQGAGVPIERFKGRAARSAPGMRIWASDRMLTTQPTRR